MVHLRKKSFVWLWIAALLTATTGVSIERIYCYCLGQTSIALFGTQECCEGKGAVAAQKSCCAQRETVALSCCAKTGIVDCVLEGLPMTPDSQIASFSDAGCTHKTTNVFQLHTEYLPEKKSGFELDYPLWFREMPFIRRLTRPVICEAHIIPAYPKPPPISGRNLCVRYQIYRC